SAWLPRRGLSCNNLCTLSSQFVALMTPWSVQKFTLRPAAAAGGLVAAAPRRRHHSPAAGLSYWHTSGAARFLPSPVRRAAHLRWRPPHSRAPAARAEPPAPC